MQNVMDAVQMQEFLSRVFRQVADDFVVEKIEGDEAVLRLLVRDQHLRPGGTVSGPAMFGLADVTAYILTLAKIGPQAMTVTTNCAIDFMRKPASGVDLLAHGRLLKMGRQLSVSEVTLFSEGHDKAVARASLTYAIPPSGSESAQAY